MDDNVEITLKPVPVSPDNKSSIDYDSLSEDQKLIANKIFDEAERQGVDPDLMLSLAHIENRFNTGASPKGALGPMQLMPGTAEELKVDPNNIDQNIYGGVTYFKRMLDKYKDPYIAGIAYNAGPGVADKFLETDDVGVIPSETLDYVDQLDRLYKPKGVDIDVNDVPVIGEMPKDKAAFERDAMAEAAGAGAGATAGLASGAYTEAKIKQAEAGEKAAQRQAASAEKRIAAGETRVAAKEGEHTGRLKIQTTAAESSVKEAARLRDAQLASEKRLAKATDNARRYGVLEEVVKTTPGGVTQQGGLGSGAMRHANVMGEVHEANVVRKGTETAGPGYSQKSRLIVPDKYAGASIYTPEQIVAQKELAAAEAEHQRLIKAADKAEGVAQKEADRLRNLTERGPAGKTAAQTSLDIAKQDYANAAAKKVPGVGTNIVRYISKIPGMSMLPGAGAGLDLVEAGERFKQGDYPGAAISGVGAVGGALSMIPPIGPVGAGLKVIGGLTSLAAPALNYYRDSREQPDKPAATAPKYAAGGVVKGYAKAGKVDLANSSKYIDGESRENNPYGYVLDDSNSRMDVSPRASLDSAVISDRGNLVHNMVGERDRLTDKYLGGAGRLASKGLEKLRDALNSSPAFDESVLYPKGSGFKLGSDLLIGQMPEVIYDYTTAGRPGPVLGNEWVPNPATGGMMHTDPYGDIRAFDLLNLLGIEVPIVAGAKAAVKVGAPLVKAGGKKLFNELASQYEAGTGIGKYMVEPRMNIVEKDKGKTIRTNDRGAEVTRASRTNKKTGQYVGAPPGIDSPQALGALVNDYVKGMEQGLPGRNFYTDSSKDIWDRTGHNMTEADLLAQNIAILSRANNVGGNTSMSAKAHIQAATGDPIKTGRFPSKDSPPLQAMYDAGQAEYLGHKRDPFATQLGVTYAPERIGRGVNDMHEAELMGYPTGKVAGATQHSFMDEIRARAIDKANQTNLGGFNDWGTGNAQAAAWSGNKIRRGDISAGDAAKSYADYLPLHEANATYESVSSPVTGHLQGLLDAPFEERLKYTFDPSGSWDTSASGRDIGYTVSGLLPGESSYTVGRFKDSANPAFVARPVIGTETTATGERVMTPGSEGALNAVEASRAYFDAQEAAAWHKLMPAKNADAYTGVTIDFGREFTKSDMEKVAPLFESKGYYIASAPDGVTIMTNPNTPVGKEFSNDIRQILKNNKNIFSKTKTDFGALKSKYIDYGDAWSSGAPGSVTKELLKYIDAAPITGSKLEGSQLYRDTVKARTARDLAAEKSGLGKVRADMVRAREIFAKDGWAGLRKAAEAGIVPAVFLSPNAVPEDWR
jgi:hypothetical protein